MYPHQSIEPKWQKYWAEHDTFECENPQKPTVLILHGWGGDSRENWLPWLQGKLQDAGYTVYVPDLPHTEKPVLEEQLLFLNKYTHLLEPNSIIIGHSLGGKLACHFAAKHHLSRGHIMLVAPTYEGQKYTSDEICEALEKYNEIPCQLDHIKLQTTVYLSDNDPYINLASAKKYYSDISDVVFHEFSGKGHFNEASGFTEFQRLFDDIVALEKKKFYALDMFPYPSGAGLHVGHPKGYTATDIIARYKHAKGYHVLHPMGWDAFGLPAENYAIKTGTHPAVTTANNITHFREQLKKFGFSFDWNREVDTTDPAYFKWSQWIFLKLFEAGLAYESDKPINFCPSCKTGLANEEVVDGKCERCGTPVEKKPIRQWVLAITKYADRLLSDIDRLDWPEGIKEMQRNWIGRSEGCQFSFTGIDCPDIEVFTTRIDTVFSAAFVVIAPDHPRVNEYILPEEKKECGKYIKKTQEESDIERTKLDKEKTGVFTGSYVINPFNKEKLPVWIGDFVLGNYGTGAVFGDAHDDRDFIFARKYGIPLKQSIAPYVTMSGENAPRNESKETKRKTVNAIIEYNNKFLVLKEPKNYRLLGGGIEDGEIPLEAIKREVVEETGYFDFSEIQEVSFSQIFARGFHHKKLHNNESHDTPCFHVVLKSLDQKEVNPSELEWHSLEWIERNEVPKLLSFEQHTYQWGQFTNPTAFTGDGILVNSGEFDGLTSEEARKVLTEKAEQEGFGKKVTNYKLRDWIFSRQRYWGEPIPLIHISEEDKKSLPTAHNTECWVDGEVLKKGDTVLGKLYQGIDSWILPDYTLPLKLPEVEKYEPSGDGQSPLATIPDWVNVRLGNNLIGKRETNTMPQWAGSCWYYLRYMDPTNSEAIVDPSIVKYWGEVDSYIGGAEHAVLHLLYARFWHKFLFDIGVVPSDEPFFKLRNVGLILGPDGEKMSKSRGNVVNPDDVIEEYGADTLRMYEMSMADFSDVSPWNTKAIIGNYRLLERIYRLFTTDEASEEFKAFLAADDMKAIKTMHKTIKKVGEDIENMKFNTAISMLNVMMNEGAPADVDNRQEWKSVLVRLLHPFAPHIAEECWSLMGNEESIYETEWPEYIEALTIDDEVMIAVQINGKLRGTYPFMRGVAVDEVRTTIESKPEIAKWLEGATILKEIFIPNKILNIVIK
ncbi:MAG: alpha/beta fold hydrolase [Candidatus Gracilibacteria bacterium]